MNKSVHIQSITINDPRNPGAIIALDIHEVDGGIIGISSDYVESVANYIANPYQECQFVMLADPNGNEDDPDPDLDEDELVGFLKIINAVDQGAMKLAPEQRPGFLTGLSKISGLSVDRIDFLLGLAKDTLDEIAFDRFSGVLRKKD